MACAGTNDQYYSQYHSSEMENSGYSGGSLGWNGNDNGCVKDTAARWLEFRNADFSFPGPRRVVTLVPRIVVILQANPPRSP
jgi:hypothetical protein